MQTYMTTGWRYPDGTTNLTRSDIVLRSAMIDVKKKPTSCYIVVGMQMKLER